MAHPVLTKGFLQLSPEAAMLAAWAQCWYSPTSSYSTLSAGAEPKYVRCIF